jgi:hypothetical protein
MPRCALIVSLLLSTIFILSVHSKVSSNEQIIFGTSPPVNSSEELKPLRFAVWGDSWASGVNYGPPSEEIEYNFPDSDEICRCRRVNEAWGVQLLQDKDISWTGGDQPLELDFQACHGAGFGDIEDQVRRLEEDKTPDFGFLMIGGNPGGKKSSLHFRTRAMSTSNFVLNSPTKCSGDAETKDR